MDSNSRSPVRDYAFRDAPLIIPAIRSRGKNRFLCRRQRHPRAVGTKAICDLAPSSLVGLSTRARQVCGAAGSRPGHATSLRRASSNSLPRFVISSIGSSRARSCRSSRPARCEGPGLGPQGHREIITNWRRARVQDCRTNTASWISRSLAFVSSRIDDDERRDPQAARQNLRGMDSNARSPASGTTISRPPRSSASSRSAL
jgi:hypothetical protein